MDTEPTSPVASSPDPVQDPPAPTAPHNINVLLHAVGILLTYGRHLIETLHQRATVAASFNAIAANFGTARLATIIAHLNRGILRAAALERVLLARAATGQDLEFLEPRTRAPKPQPAPTAEPEQPVAVRPAPRQRASRPADGNNPEFIMPTPEELERQVRRRPIGRTILEICLDLAVAPGHCHGDFWNELFAIMSAFGGSVAKLMVEKSRRRQAFDKEQDRIRDRNWDWLDMSREQIRQAIGFFIGEPPVNPLDPAAAIATAPP